MLKPSWHASLVATDGTEALDDLLSWIVERNRVTHVEIERIGLADCSPWTIDSSGCILNDTGSFFSICGLKSTRKDLRSDTVSESMQPIIIQDEIGFLGIIAHEFNGVMHFLMQAKIEPGNVNKVQISPTIQATRSNFTQAHGGKEPAYLKYFLEAQRHRIVVDQAHSEQASRFLGKRNRNMILEVSDDVDVLATHKWMTLAQIKALLRHDNLVNMDTRTVLSCIPWGKDSCDTTLMRACNLLNDCKMFSQIKSETVSLRDLDTWSFDDERIYSEGAPFQVIYCDISIEGREVVRWRQPLFEACGKALFGLFLSWENSVPRFLVRVTPEIGSFDCAEFGPSVQMEAGWENRSIHDYVVEEFLARMRREQGVVNDVILSEEGGRFFCEENRNVIIEVDPHLAENLDAADDCLWVDFATLNEMCRMGNMLNIQLRNLIALLDSDRFIQYLLKDEAR